MNYLLTLSFIVFGVVVLAAFALSAPMVIVSTEQETEANGRTLFQAAFLVLVLLVAAVAGFFVQR